MRKCDIFVKELTCPRSPPLHVPLIRSGEMGDGGVVDWSRETGTLSCFQEKTCDESGQEIQTMTSVC